LQGVGDEAPGGEYTGGVRQVEKSREALAPYWRGVDPP
jgi:hypothetical protein